MIKASTIIAQLQAVLPTQTDLFSNADITISSLTRASTTVTAVTSSAHGLITGNYVNILNAKTPITITSIASVANTGIGASGSIVTVLTATNHDFTEGFDFTAEISGADQAAYNGTFTILTVANRRTFTYAITTQPATPATGTMVLLNNNATGYNGRKQVTVTDTTTFTYETTLTPDSPAQGTPTFRSGVRVTGAISWERARQAYTKQAADKLWAFVVLGDNSISKDRRITTDAISTLTYGDAYRQRMIIPFSIYIYAPCVNEVAGRAVRDQMEDVRVALYKSILRAELDSVLAETNLYVVTAAGDRYVEYTGAYYIHEFIFELVADITIGDTVAPEYNVAFRDFSLQFDDPDNVDGDDIIMHTADIDLDDVPL